MGKLQEKRQQRVRRIRQAVKQASDMGEAVYKDKFIAKLSIEWGIARRTALEYLKELIDAEIISEEREKVGTSKLGYELEGEYILTWIPNAK